MLLLQDIPESQIMFFDIETNHQYAAYAELKMIGVQYGLNGTPALVESPKDKHRFKDALRDPDMLKVSFNGVNFDNLVLWRHGFAVEPKGMHDCFLMMKTIAPGLPAYSLKFINWYYFGDMHLPEMELEGWALRNKQDKWAAPKSVLGPYCLYDVHPQTLNIFRMAWEVVQRPLHWRAYTEVELAPAMAMEEMMLRGGEYLDADRIRNELARCEVDRAQWNSIAELESDGKVINANSTKQVGAYLDLEGFEIELTEAGNWSLPKTELLDLRDQHPIAEAMFQVRRLNNAMSYYRNYLDALNHDERGRTEGWIPKQYSLSRARTRRILSDSMYKINFQNPSAEAKAVQVVPPGWLGVWIDATQIENVVHIYESDDHVRRADYESTKDWSEYVWLCNKILGTDLTKRELDDIKRFPAPSNPTWSVYKLYKTIKLALNFGMGVDKFRKHTSTDALSARSAFDTVHRACPAIKRLQDKLRKLFVEQGYVQDVFGHIYVADPKRIYKIVAYLIQGCGTGSLPKACIAALYDVVHECDVSIREADVRKLSNYVADLQRRRACFGVLNGTTHDEIAARLSLDLGDDDIHVTLRRMHFVMTEMFSPLFDGIPLRAKMYLSRTTAKEAIEIDPDDYDSYAALLKRK